MGLPAKLTEAEFTKMVIRYAQLHGFRVAHFRPARTKSGWRTPCQGDAVGWPDLFMVRDGVIVAAELKVGRGKTTEAQQAWLADLAACGVPTYVWSEKDWPAIEQVLGAPTNTGEST